MNQQKINISEQKINISEQKINISEQKSNMEKIKIIDIVNKLKGKSNKIDENVKKHKNKF